MPKAKGHVVHQQYICSGCRTCELTCVLSHEQLINPQLARNKVETDVQQAYLTDVLYCQQCDDARCLAACPTGALHVDEATGAVTLHAVKQGLGEEGEPVGEAAVEEVPVANAAALGGKTEAELSVGDSAKIGGKVLSMSLSGTTLTIHYT